MKPPTHAELVWQRGLVFEAHSAGRSVTIDGDSAAGMSPVQALAFALAGCMSSDVVHILRKGRHPLEALRATLVGERAPEDPHRFTRIDLTFHVTGPVAREAVERAIALSHEKYCSVWHSMRQDIAFTTHVTLDAPEGIPDGRGQP
jgi:putative redox protein